MVFYNVLSTILLKVKVLFLLFSSIKSFSIDNFIKYLFV